MWTYLSPWWSAILSLTSVQDSIACSRPFFPVVRSYILPPNVGNLRRFLF